MNENQIRENFRRVVLEKVEDVFERYLDESVIPKKIESYRYITDQIAEEQTDLSFDDFMQQSYEVSEDEINDQVRDYVNDEFDSDFFMVKIEAKIDTDQIEEELREEMVLLLMNTEPYSGVPREYWYTQSRRVYNVEELAEYTKMDGLEVFAEKYAADWEEVAKQNQE